MAKRPRRKLIQELHIPSHSWIGPAPLNSPLVPLGTMNQVTSSDRFQKHWLQQKMGKKEQGHSAGSENQHRWTRDTVQAAQLDPTSENLQQPDVGWM